MTYDEQHERTKNHAHAFFRELLRRRLPLARLQLTGRCIMFVSDGGYGVYVRFMDHGPVRVSWKNIEYDVTETDEQLVKRLTSL